MSKPTDTFELLLHTSSKNLPTILSALEGAAKLVSIKVLAIQQDAPAAKPQQSRYIDSKHKKGIFGKDLVLQLLSDGKIHSVSEMRSAFSSHGFAETSYSPCCSRLFRSGKIIQTSPQHYQLALLAR